MKYSYGQNILDVQHAIYEKEIFVGYYMLCRYLNGRGYTRYGCNAGYDKSIGTNGKDRLNPCKILCPRERYYYTKVRSLVIKLVEMGYVYTKKVNILDSINEDLPTYRKAKRFDNFVLIAGSQKIIDKFLLEENTIEKKLKLVQEKYLNEV